MPPSNPEPTSPPTSPSSPVGEAAPSPQPQSYTPDPVQPQVVVGGEVQVSTPQPNSAYPPMAKPVPSTQNTPAPAGVIPQPYTTSSTSRRPLILAAVATAVVIGLSVAGWFFLTSRQPITLQDVSNAQEAASAFNTDVYQATTSINNAQIADSVAGIKTDLDQANAKLSDAQTRFAILKKSKVNHDQNVKKAFNALNAKWTPYLAFLQGLDKDTQGLAPILVQYNDDTKSLYKAPPKTAPALTAYFKTLKQAVDTTSHKVARLKPILPEDQSMLDAFKTDLRSSSQALGKGQSSLTAGAQPYTVNGNLLDVLSAQTTFDITASNIDDQLRAKQTALSPTKAFDNYQSSLDSLSKKVH